MRIPSRIWLLQTGHMRAAGKRPLRLDQDKGVCRVFRIVMKTFEERKQRATLVCRMLDALCPKARMILEYSNHWELLVAVMLSAQCTDLQVNKVTKQLFQKYPLLDDYIRATPSVFEQDIFSTGFYKNKTKNILAAAKVVRDRFGECLPKTIPEMLVIPGVGRKTANVVLGNAFGIVEGIAVDTHVKRLARLFGLTTAEDPDAIEQDLMAVLPKSKWFQITYQMIDYGRRYCTARCRHTDCPIFQKIIF